MATLEASAALRGAVPRRQLWAIALLTAANVLHRLPALMNSRSLHSDAAVVGLQGMHLLHGELSKFLWGASYQGSFEAMVAALFFWVGGATPLMLMLSALAGHLVLTGLAFSVLARHVGPGKAMVLSAVLVFAPQAINNISVYPPRQWCLTAVFAAVWLIDRGRPVQVLLGTALAAISLWLDLYALPLAALIVLWAWVTDWRRTVPGLVAGALALAVLRQPHHVIGSAAGVDLSRLGHNIELFLNPCFAMIVSVRVFNAEEWQSPLPFHVWQVAGAAVLLSGMASALPLARARRIRFETRALGLLGLAIACGSVVGFLASKMPVDAWSARYLAPVIWFAPFALAPLVSMLRPRAMVLFVPYLSSAAIAGWMTFVVAPPDEIALADYLRAHHVKYAAAPYWVAYRLTFLFHEDPIITPLEGSRYAPYLEGLERETGTVAYINHPSQQPLPAMDAAGTLEATEVAGYTVTLRAGAAPR